MSESQLLWQEHWGRRYEEDFKQRFHGLQLLDLLWEDGIDIGRRILEVGSGAHPVVEFLTHFDDTRFPYLSTEVHVDEATENAPPEGSEKEAYQVIGVDIAATQGKRKNIYYRRDGREKLLARELFVQYDLMDLLSMNDPEKELENHKRCREIQDEVRAFLGFPKLDPERKPKFANFPQADTIIVSEVLNYVDLQVINQLVRFLKPNGKLIIFDRPNRGFTEPEFFHPNGLRNNNQLREILEMNPQLKLLKTVQASAADINPGPGLHGLIHERITEQHGSFFEQAQLAIDQYERKREDKPEEAYMMWVVQKRGEKEK